MSGKYFTGDQKLSKKLIGRTKEALRQRNVQFAQTHGDASDEELLDYVRGEAARQASLRAARAATLSSSEVRRAAASLARCSSAAIWL